MESGRSRNLTLLAILFLSAYFFLFSYDGLSAYFTFDDGMNMIHLHHLWEVPLRTNVLDALQVFTPAYRPLGALFYRPLYHFFGFNPLPFRIVVYCLLIFNTVLAYRFFRALDATAEAATLATLLFCYNASMVDLYYNSGTIYDLLCFPLYLGAVLIYTRRQLDFRTMLMVMLLFLAALDAKEMAVTLPAALLLYEAVYRYRDLMAKPVLLRTGGFLIVMFGVSAAFLRIKLKEMSGNSFYHPHLSVPYMLTSMGHYFEQLLYLPPESFGALQVGMAIVALLGMGAVLRSRTVVYGTLFFVLGLLPLSVIQHRTGYAAYVAYPGLALALATLLESARTALLRVTRKEHLQLASTVLLFLCVAAVSIKCFAHTRKILMSNALWDQGRRVDLLTGLKRAVPELPPNARILILDDPWDADWGPMFLIELLYHDPVWVDRVRNELPIGNRDSYDLVISYEQPFQGPKTTRMLGIRKTWETHWIPVRAGRVTVTAPDEDRAFREVVFSPSTSRSGGTVKLTVPGLSSVGIDAIYRIVSKHGVSTHNVDGWCALDSAGSCNMSAPDGGEGETVAVDWIRPTKGRWIFTHGALRFN